MKSTSVDTITATGEVPQITGSALMKYAEKNEEYFHMVIWYDRKEN
jgi:hypothetical protein